MTLRGFTDVGQALLSDQLEANLVEMFNWGLLEKGGFVNVTLPASGVFGGSPSRLRPVQDPYYQDGQLWESYRQDWVHESGINYSRQPIQVSGVYVDGSFKPIGATGTYSFHINYPLGQVLFDTPISPSSVVQCEYSFRQYPFKPGDIEWWQQIQFNSQRVDDGHFLTGGSGSWSILGQNRFQLPAVVVEAVPETRREGYELGASHTCVYQQVYFHVLSETKWDRNWLHDMIGLQFHSIHDMFDKQQMVDRNGFPLNQYGDLQDTRRYHDWLRPSGTGGFAWGPNMRFNDVRSVEQRGVGPLYYCLVAATIKVDAL